MIESLDNKKVKAWRKLHQKKYRNGEYLLKEEALIKEAMENGYLKTLLYVGKAPFEFTDSVEVSKEVLDKIAMEEGYAYLGIGKEIEERFVPSARVMLLEELADPLNIGRILESAYLFGFDTVILCGQCADLYHEKCLSASKGALYHLNIVHMDSEEAIDLLHEKGYRVYATGLRDHVLSLNDVPISEKMAFILGNEGSGVKEETFERSDGIAKIDMHNIDSLNVAMAGAIVLHRFGIIEQ